MSLRSDDLDSVGELYTENEFRQLVVAIEATPAFLGGLGELEDHGERSLVRKASLGAHRAVAYRRERAMSEVIGVRLARSGAGARTEAKHAHSFQDRQARRVALVRLNAGLIKDSDRQRQQRVEIVVPKIRFCNNGDEVRRGRAQIQCRPRTGWRDGLGRLC